MAVDLQPEGRRSGGSVMRGCLGQTHLTGAQPAHCGDPAPANLWCEQKADIGAIDPLFDRIQAELKGAKAKLLLGTGKHHSILQNLKNTEMMNATEALRRDPDHLCDKVRDFLLPMRTGHDRPQAASPRSRRLAIAATRLRISARCVTW